MSGIFAFNELCIFIGDDLLIISGYYYIGVLSLDYLLEPIF